jgi:hypothetical protein
MAASNVADFEIDFSNDYWPGAILLGCTRVAKKCLTRQFTTATVGGETRGQEGETCGRRGCGVGLRLAQPAHN